MVGSREPDFGGAHDVEECRNAITSLLCILSLSAADALPARAQRTSRSSTRFSNLGSSSVVPSWVNPLRS